MSTENWCGLSPFELERRHAARIKQHFGRKISEAREAKADKVRAAMEANPLAFRTAGNGSTYSVFRDGQEITLPGISILGASAKASQSSTGGRQRDLRRVNGYVAGIYARRSGGASMAEIEPTENDA